MTAQEQLELGAADAGAAPRGTPLTNRWDFVLFLDVTNGNPNGDPDAGNMPRMDPETNQGLMSDVSIKRKVRDYVGQLGEPRNRIFIQSGKPLNETIAEAYDALELPSFRKSGGGWDKKAANERPRREVDLAQEWLCSQFFDIRAFGGVLSTGPNAGQIRGPVQFTFATSAEKIMPAEITITRVVDVDKVEPEMGRKHIVPYGLYRMHGFVSPAFAKRTGFDEADLALLWKSLQFMCDATRSASKGDMESRRLLAFRHECSLGDAQAHRLFERIKVYRVCNGDEYPVGDTRTHNWPPARAFSDYRIDVDDRELPSGVTLHEPW
jgi:CRISPR-associated protein Csd2